MIKAMKIPHRYAVLAGACAFAAGLSACRPSTGTAYATPPAVSTAVQTATSTPSAPGEFDLRWAMELLYGSEGTSETNSSGEPIVRIPGVPGSDDPRDRIILPLLAQRYREAGEEKFILLTETGPEGMGAHAEYASIGGALFHWTGSGWEIEIDQRHITDMGSFGHAPPGRLISIGPDRHGFLFEPEWAGQGSVSQYAFVIGIVGSEFRVVFSHEIRIHGEVEDAVWDYAATVEFIPGGNPEYYDIRVFTRGTKPSEGGTVEPFETVEVYEFDGREYVPKPG